MTMTTPMDLRNEGQAATIAADCAAHRGAGEYIAAVIEEYADSGREFTADDVREALRDNEKVRAALIDRPNLLPAHLGSAARRGLIEGVAFYRPSRASRRASRNLVWKGTTK